MKPQTRKSCFSLIELLVVIAIIVILAAMLLPALNQARGRARRADCTSSLKMLGFLFNSYTDSYHGFLPAVSTDGGNVTWRTRLAIFNGINETTADARDIALAKQGFYCKANTALHPKKGVTMNYGMNDRVAWYQTQFAKVSQFKYPSQLCLASDGTYTDVGSSSWYNNHINNTVIAYITTVHGHPVMAQILFLDGHAAAVAPGKIPVARKTPFWWGRDAE